MSDLASNFLTTSMAVLVGVALLPVLAKFVGDAAGIGSLSSSQKQVVNLLLVIWALGMSYAAFKIMSQ